MSIEDIMKKLYELYGKRTRANSSAGSKKCAQEYNAMYNQ